MSSLLGKHVSKLLLATTAGLLVNPSQSTNSPQHYPKDTIDTATSFTQPLVQQDSVDLAAEADTTQSFPLLKNAYKYCHKDKYAAIVIDAVTGEVIYHYNGYKLLHPASLVKNMTLFRAFKAIESGELSMDDQLTIHPGYNYKTNIGLCTIGVQPGEAYEVAQAFEGIVTKSAADATIPLAEQIAGTEEKFADEMNVYGQKIGLFRTTFRNSSGTTDSKQLSCAYDMAQLMRAEMQYFPEQCKIYKTKSFSFHDKPVKGHDEHNKPFKNHALFADADMAKTGYLKVSGFNTVASFVRNDRRYIVSVWGGKTQHMRNTHALEVLDEGIKLAEADTTNRLIGPVNNTPDFSLFPIKRDFRELDANPQDQLAQNALQVLTPIPFNNKASLMIRPLL